MNIVQRQVDAQHYDFGTYMGKDRWVSVWHQLQELHRLKPQRTLEIGPGPGVLKSAAACFGVSVETFDLDPALAPDHVGSVTAMPFTEGEFDVVCAFQMLEHLPYEESLRAFREMVRVARRSVLISLPDAEKVFRWQVWIPRVAAFDRLIPVRGSRPQAHRFDGQHYWEVNKLEHPLSRVVADFGAIARMTRTYRVHEMPYHRFFIFER